MLRIDQLRLHPGQQETLLRARCAKLLRVAPADITACTVLRKAIDAREDLTLVYTVSVSVKNEAQVLRRCRDKRVSVYKQEVYFLPPPVTAPAVRPIVVGAGPAGLFAALVLARFIGYAGVCLASPLAWLGSCALIIPTYLATLRRLLPQEEPSPDEGMAGEK